MFAKQTPSTTSVALPWGIYSIVMEMKNNRNWLWLFLGVIVAIFLMLPSEKVMNEEHHRVSFSNRINHHMNDQFTRVINHQMNVLINAE